MNSTYQYRSQTAVKNNHIVIGLILSCHCMLCSVCFFVFLFYVYVHKSAWTYA